MLVTLGVIESTKYFGRGVKGAEQGVIFNAWTSTIYSILQGGQNKTSQGANFACTAAFDSVLLNPSGGCQSVDFKWPAYCSGVSNQLDATACALAGGTSHYSTKYITNGATSTKEGLLIGASGFQLCPNPTPAMTIAPPAHTLLPSAFTVANSQITSLSHGYKTASPSFPYTVGQFTTTGSLPSGSPGLLTGTDYYVIAVNGDAFQVATSAANALAGTAVTFTNQGSGVHTFTPTGDGIYQVSAKLTATKSTNAGGTSQLTWGQTFYATLHKMATNQYKIVDCSVVSPTPIPVNQPNAYASFSGATPTPIPALNCLGAATPIPLPFSFAIGHASSLRWGFQPASPSTWTGSYGQIANTNNVTERIRVEAVASGIHFRVISAGGSGYSYNTNNPATQWGGGGGGGGGYQEGLFTYFNGGGSLPNYSAWPYCLEISWRWNPIPSSGLSYTSVDLVTAGGLGNPSPYQRYTLANVNNAAASNSNVGGARGEPNPRFCTNNIYGNVTLCKTYFGVAGTTVVAGAPYCGGRGGASCQGAVGCPGGGVPGGIGGGYVHSPSPCNCSAPGTSTNTNATPGEGGGGGGYLANVNNTYGEGGNAQVTIWW